MKKTIFLLVLLPLCSFAQSDDGMGTIALVPPLELSQVEYVEAYTSQGTKIKKGVPVKLFEWYDYEEGGLIMRFRREYKAEEYFYDDNFALVDASESNYKVVATHSKKGISMEPLKEGTSFFVHHWQSKVYDPTGQLQATIYFDKGRPTQIHINHYYGNGMLQFVREITSQGEGEPFLNTGVLEAYYPDGSVFENPITEDGTAIIILNDLGEVEDECACMGENIMEWGQGYLSSFLGKYYYFLQHVYQVDGLECCWE